MEIKTFKFICTPEITFGEGSINILGKKIKELKGTKAFIVIDKSLFSIKEQVKNILDKENIQYLIYDELTSEPTTDIGNYTGKLAKSERCDIVCGIGGGSSLDVAKAVSILITNDGTVEDYQGLGKVPKPGVSKIMIPTTAGTGSEATFTAVFIREKEKTKGGINSVYLYPECAILDPSLTLSLPKGPTAFTGMDAFCHAIESYISNKSNFFTESICEKAMEMIWKNLPVAYNNPDDIKARGNMLYASFIASIGLVNAGVTAVHSLSYPLGGLFGVPHGTGNALLLPYVLEAEIPEIEIKLSKIGTKLMGKKCEPELFIDELKKFERNLKIPEKLSELKIPKEAIEQITEGAMKIAVPLANNPKIFTKQDIINIYNRAY
ncbi:MAG: iron-containing alcohol dehydrogenase [Candidatus Omnitrophica bacterium]|jgi:alcohol dehydrogenase|nr:iron-containing alcohol dehydrogenase [Candidatus Omnitrophota bacterium]